MPQTELEAMYFTLDAKIDKMAKSLAKADAQTAKSLSGMQKRFDATNARIQEGFGAGLQEAASRVPLLGNALGALGGPAAIATTAIAGMALALGQAHEAMNWADDLQALADHIGVTAEQLQVLDFAAEEADVEVAALHDGLKNLNGSLGAIQTGVGAAKIEKAFAAINITPEQLKGMDNASDLLPLLADRISALGTRAEQVQIARKLGIEELLPMLQHGAKGFEDVTNHARELGIVLDNKTVGALAEMNREVQIAQQQIDVQLKKAFLGLAPAITDVTKATADFITTLTRIPQTGPDASWWDKYRIAMERARLVQAGWEKGKFGEANDAFVAAGMAKRAPGPASHFGRGARYADLSPKLPVLAPMAHSSASGGKKKKVDERTQVATVWDGGELEKLGLGSAHGLIPEVNDGLKETAELANNVSDDFKAMGHDIASSLGEAIAYGDDLGDTFANLFKRIEAEFLSRGIENIFDQLTGGQASGKGGDGWLAGASNLLDSFFSPPAHALGTNFAPGGLSLVGEKGPELVNLPRGAQVFSNARSNAMLNSIRGSRAPVAPIINLDLRGAVMTQDLLDQMNAIGQQAAIAGARGGAAIAGVQLAKRRRNTME